MFDTTQMIKHGPCWCMRMQSVARLTFGSMRNVGASCGQCTEIWRSCKRTRTSVEVPLSALLSACDIRCTPLHFALLWSCGVSCAQQLSADKLRRRDVRLHACVMVAPMAGWLTTAITTGMFPVEGQPLCQQMQCLSWLRLYCAKALGCSAEIANMQLNAHTHTHTHTHTINAHRHIHAQRAKLQAEACVHVRCPWPAYSTLHPVWQCAPSAVFVRRQTKVWYLCGGKLRSGAHVPLVTALGTRAAPGTQERRGGRGTAVGITCLCKHLSPLAQAALGIGGRP